MHTSIKAENVSAIDTIVHVLFLLLLAILPVSGTIALRNLILVLLTIGALVFLIVAPKRYAYPLRVSIRHLSWPILMWVGVLLLFPLWAGESAVAWKSLGGEWIPALLAGFVGYATFHWLGRKGPSLLVLGFVSSVPLLLHLMLCVAAVLGLLDNTFYADPSLSTLWNSLRHPGAYASNPHWTLQTLMHGFRGLEPMHGNLGYPACQSIAIFCAGMAHSPHERHLAEKVSCALGIAVCFLSILIAQSRGAILYAFLIMAFAAVLLKQYVFPQALSSDDLQKLGSRWGGKVLIILTVVLMLIVTYQYAKRDSRWWTMADSVNASLAFNEPSKILCNGLDANVQEDVRNRLQGHDPQYVDGVIGGLNSDGARIMLMRVGLGLVLENPLGLDGSRHTYQKLIREKCGHEPAMPFAHAHNGWIDLGLALGWLGMVAFGSLLLYFLRSGLSGMKSNIEPHWAIALVLLSAFWILRGLADSVYREHYIQMQLLLLMYLLGQRQYAPRHTEKGMQPG